MSEGSEHVKDATGDATDDEEVAGLAASMGGPELDAAPEPGLVFDGPPSTTERVEDSDLSAADLPDDEDPRDHRLPGLGTTGHP